MPKRPRALGVRCRMSADAVGTGARGMSGAILETPWPEQGVQGFHRGQQGQSLGRARFDPRAHRPQRRRQDDLLQPAHEVPRAHQRHDPVQRRGTSRASARRRSRGAASSARSRSRPCSRTSDAAGERAPGAAAQAGHPVLTSGRARSRSSPSNAPGASCSPRSALKNSPKSRP